MVYVEDGLRKRAPLVAYDIVEAAKRSDEYTHIMMTSNTFQLLQREVTMFGRDLLTIADPKDIIDKLSKGKLFDLHVLFTGENAPAFAFVKKRG